MNMSHGGVLTDAASRALLQEVNESDSYFLLVYRDEEDRWMTAIQDKCLLVFRNKDDAAKYGRLSVIGGGESEPKEYSRAGLADRIEELEDDGQINSICLYWFTPVSTIFSDLAQFQKRGLRKDPRVFINMDGEIEKTKKLLQLINEDERAKIDPNYKLIIANAHVLLNHFVDSFDLSLSEIAQKTGLSEEKLEKFRSDYGASDVFDRKEFRALLDYFQVGDYMYYFKEDCDEVNIWVNNHSMLDTYPIAFPPIDRIREVFTIRDVTRGRSEEDYAFIYKVSLEAKTRNLDVYLSNPLGCVVGRKCEVRNLSETIDDNPVKNEAQQSSNLTEDKIEQAKKDFASRSSGTGRRVRTRTKKVTQEEGNEF